MLKIYGADLSAPANKVRMTANALGIQYEYIRISIRDGENRTEEYLKMHPAGKVPVINDDGFVLFESDAIVKYLAAKQNSPLYRDEIKQRALIDQWMDFVTIHVGGAMSKILFNRVFAPFAKVPVDQNSLNDGVKFLSRFLPVVDQQLSRARYLAGEQLSLADISLLATLDPSEIAEVSLAPYENIVQWRGELRKKEFYTKCHSSYEEAMNNFISRK